MTSSTKAVSRRTDAPHSKHQRRIIVTIQGEAVGFRLERSTKQFWLPIETLYDQAERKTAAAIAGFDPGPCRSPRRSLNV